MFLKGVKKVLKSVKKSLRNFSKEYPNVSQVIQLTFIYFFAIVDLFYAVLNNVFSLGYFPEVLLPIFPFVRGILQSPFLRLWASPEKVFFLSYLVVEFMVVRSIFKFTKLVKYNILLIFSLLMVQGLVISYWDLLFNREIVNVSRWAYDQGSVLYTDKHLATTFFLNTFLVFMLGYLFLYVRALQGKFGTIPGMEWLTDSVAFWLHIKTPTMRFGNDANGANDEEEKKK
jgi:hypothetical protein